MNRRQFAFATTLAGAAVRTARAERTATAAGRIPEAAGLITEMVFIDDCIRVAMYDRNLSGAAKTALTAHPDFVHNGALWPAAGSDTSTGEKLALTAGRACSESLQRQRQPNSPEARLYQDVAVMRDLAEKAGRDPGKSAPVGDLLGVLHVRRRLGLHTLNPDDDIQNWLEGIVTWWKDEKELLGALAAAYTKPDSAKTRAFVSDFYNPSDPVIRLARSFQFAGVAPVDAFAGAIDQAHRGSRYARALAGALESLPQLPEMK